MHLIAPEALTSAIADRLERKKYNPFLKKVTIHREIK